MIEIVQRPLFELVQETHQLLREKEALESQYIDVVVRIGQNLIEMRPYKPYGEFLPFVEAEFNMSRQRANEHMHIAEEYGNNVRRVGHFSYRVVAELAAPSTPEKVREQVETGQISATIPAIREAKQEMAATNLVSSPTLTEHEASLAGYRGYDNWQEAQKWEDKIQIDKPLAPNPVVDEAREKRDTHVMQVMGSSESPEWYTPQEIVQLSSDFLGEIDLDPCSNSHETPNVPAHTLFTKEDNGLSQVWEGKVYLNPPYGSEIPPWIDKLVKSYGHGVTEAIALLPARIDTLWFQPLYDYPMCNIRGRLQFENASNSAPFPSVIVYLGERVEDFIRTFQHKGPIMRRIG